jgi:two-component sensor histidine kinase/CheY-like chemotaxis protein
MPSVMIAEDDLLVADMLEDVLVHGGYDVCGIARTVAKAVELGERCKPDLAILDIRLAEGGLGTDIPARLMNAAQMGILYASGHTLPNLTKAVGTAVIRKPYRPDDILRAVRIVEQIVETGEASRPFPEKFTLLNGSFDGTVPATPTNFPPDAVARLLRQQAALAKFGTFAFGANDVKSVLAEAARVCAEGLDVTFCKICRYRPEENDLLIEAGVGWHAGLVGQVVSQADDSSPQGRAFVTEKPVICINLAREATFVPPAFYADHNIVSTVDVVIPGAGRPYGILEIDNPNEHIYDEYDINFLTGFANSVAGAVDSAKRKSANAATIAEKDRLLTVQRSLLNEKAVLARELNHRVRNNLQLVHGMLDREIRYSDSNSHSGTAAFSAIARRVMALSQVYDHLLGSGLSQTIEFGQYLSSLCSGLTALERVQHPDIQFACRSESIMLDLDTVTALGLIVAELIANSFDHAFPVGTGSIRVTLSADRAGDGATLIFDDDGPGFVDTGNSKRNGLGLVKRLMEQIGGTATLRSDHGTEWTLRIPKKLSPVETIAKP